MHTLGYDSFEKWYVEHPRTSHATQLVGAGGFVHLVCTTCAVAQHVDDVAAGNPVAPRKEGGK